MFSRPNHTQNVWISVKKKFFFRYVQMLSTPGNYQACLQHSKCCHAHKTLFKAKFTNSYLKRLNGERSDECTKSSENALSQCSIGQHTLTLAPFIGGHYFCLNWLARLTCGIMELVNYTIKKKTYQSRLTFVNLVICKLKQTQELS